MVTGGASGLGRGAVDRLVREGAKVVIADLPSSKGQEAANELGADKAMFVPLDVRLGFSFQQRSPLIVLKLTI